MDFSLLIAIMSMTVLGLAWYANSRLRNKIYCSFRRVNKTKIEKFVRMTSRYVIFDGRRYDIIPSCVTLLWWDKGFIHQLFPQNVVALDFTHESRFPLDPNTLKPVIISPEVRGAMNKEEWVKSYAKGFAPPSGKKQSMIQQYLPLITVGFVVLLGFYLYSNQQALSQQIAIMQNTLNAITK